MRLSLIKEQGDCPPDGFRYVDPVDGWTAHAWTYNDWVDLQKAHLQANGRNVPSDLGVEMQDQLCKTLPPGWCNFDNPQRRRPGTSLGWGDVVEGAKTFSRWISGGMKLVGQSEADRRAFVCSRCYLNVNVEGCASCHKLVQEVVGHAKTQYDFALKACAVCKCLLRAKVHFPIDVLNKENDNLQEMYPSHCWLKKGGENYNG